MSSLINIIFQIKRDALFGSDVATSVKRRKTLPITETPCTSTTEPAMIIATKEHVHTSTQLGGEGAPLKFNMYSKVCTVCTAKALKPFLYFRIKKIKLDTPLRPKPCQLMPYDFAQRAIYEKNLYTVPNDMHKIMCRGSYQKKITPECLIYIYAFYLKK